MREHYEISAGRLACAFVLAWLAVAVITAAVGPFGESPLSSLGQLLMHSVLSILAIRQLATGPALR